MSTKPAIRVDNLTHRFKQTKAVDNMSFKVEEGSIHGFVGPNGAGKTTTLRILATLLPPQRGTVRLHGYDVRSQYKNVRRRIGYMPDHFSMYRQMTVFEYLDFFGAAYGMALADRTRVIEDVLALTDMQGRRGDLIKALSRGMQQRVSLARVLVHDPQLLLLDEPASGLDPRARIELMEILRELSRMGKTIFISSHILSELAELCDSVTIIDRGSVKYSGRMSDLAAQDSRSRRYVLHLDDHMAFPADLLLREEGVVGVEPLAEGNGVTIEFDGEVISPTEVLRRALDAGARVASFRPDVRHLNQAFLELTEAGVP